MNFINTHQSLECLSSTPPKTPPSSSPHSHSCNLEEAHGTMYYVHICSDYRETKNLCLAFLKSIHNLQPDDVTFVET